MMITHYSENAEQFSAQEIELHKTHIENRDLNAWHALMGNVCQHAQDAAYRALVKPIVRLLFEAAREDEAFQILAEDDYRVIFPKIMDALSLFSDDDPEFLAVSAHVHRDARFGLHDYTNAAKLSARAAEQNNTLGMMVLAYQYFYGQGVTQDKDKAFDLVDQAILIDPIQGNAVKASLFFRAQNYPVAENVIQSIQDYEQSKYAGLIDTIKAELALTKQEGELALQCLQQATQYNQSGYPDYTLGRLLLYGGPNITPDPDQGLIHLENATKKGASYAELMLGYYYCYNAPELDLQKGFEHIRHAATYNDTHAKFELARLMLYQDAFDATQKTQGVEILERIKEENLDSYIHLGYLYLSGQVVPHKDLERGQQYLLEAIKKGHGPAATYLAKEYQNGVFNEANNFEPQYEQALHWYEAGSELKDTEAVEMAGHYYRMGLGAEKNPEKALAYIQQGVEVFNSSFSKTELALCYETGFGIEQDYSKALEWYLKACEDNYPYACYRAGLYYRDGVHHPQNTPDFDKSFAAFNKAANLGDRLAKYEVAKAFFYGEGTEKNVDKALNMYAQNLEDKVLDAAVDLALYYEQEGNNPEQAFSYMKTAVDEGQIPFAFLRLGIYHYQGFGTTTNVEEAAKYFKVAGANGHGDAYLFLGNIELWQEAPDSKEENAFEYYAKAAEADRYNEGLGICYKYGIGVDEDDTKAFEAFTKGAAAGSTSATYYLAMSYLQGEGVTKNEATAFEHFKQIAEQDTKAKYQLSRLYMNGKGTSQNLELGIQYLHQAAEEMYPQAQFELANAYLVGNGVEENDDLALEWYTKAAEGGNEEALRIVKSSKKV
ncbi:MAG TPA: hypothetical protein DCS93_24030 [Microscillaceae bacterium]|nr:hypothetical protein [Microscillaceae bacterium]